MKKTIQYLIHMQNIDRIRTLSPKDYFPEAIPPDKIHTACERIRGHMGQILPFGHGMAVRYMRGATIPVYPPVFDAIMRFDIEQLRAILLTRSVFQTISKEPEMIDVIYEKTIMKSDYVPERPVRSVRRGRFNPAEYEKVYWEYILEAFGAEHIIFPKGIKYAEQEAAVSAKYKNPIRDKATREETEVKETVITRELKTPGPEKVELWEETLVPPELQGRNIDIILVRSINGISGDLDAIFDQIEVIRAVGSWVYQKFSPHSESAEIQTTFADYLGNANNISERNFLEARARGEELLKNAGANLKKLILRRERDKAYIPIIFIQKDIPLDKKVEMFSNLDIFIDRAIERCGNCTVVQLGQERSDLSEWLSEYRDSRLLNVVINPETLHEGTLRIIDHVIESFAGN